MMPVKTWRNDLTTSLFFIFVIEVNLIAVAGGRIDSEEWSIKYTIALS